MNISSDTLVGEVVKYNFKTASVFQKNNIDYCCGGKKSLSEACAEAGVETGNMIQNLEKIFVLTDPDSLYINGLSLSELADYIVKRHHTYVRENIEFLNRNTKKIWEVHGHNHPELFKVKELFALSAGNLIMHMQKEEILLFPYIKNLELAKKNNSIPARPVFAPITNPIALMIEEHENEGNRFSELSSVTNNYDVPQDACTTYEVTLNLLKDFENDLHRHIHLENNILFPKAVDLEKDLIGKYF
jgi:regulator of cell morphogenesis and NO signaling